MARGRTRTFLIRTFDGELGGRSPVALAVEEPLEIHLDDTLVGSITRTPGHDFELAAGWCLTAGLLDHAPIETVRYCGTGSAVETEFNVVSVATASGGRPTREPAPAPASLSWELLAAASGAMVAGRPLASATGGMRAGAFDATGRLTVEREDIALHNAVDKVVGRLLLDDRLPAATLGLAISGPATAETVATASAAGFPVVVAIDAPSSLAVERARAAGVTLAGWVAGEAMRVYAGEGVDD